MSQTAVPAQRADRVFRTGPETLIAETPTIVAGLVADYSKQVAEQTQFGAETMPLKWVVNAELNEPQILKGRAATPTRRFSRHERSLFLSDEQPLYYWEDDYGLLQPDGRAVLFIGGGTQKQALHVVPSGSGEQDLIALVKDIVKIQSLKQPQERMQRWLEYVRLPASDEGLKAALRTMVNASIEWAKLAPELERLLTDARQSSYTRVYAFGIVAFGVVEEKWGGHRRQAVDFLGRIFTSEQDAQQAIQYMQYLKLILSYSDDESHRHARQPLRRQLLDYLKRRETEGRSTPQLENQFRQIRAAYESR